MILLEGSNHPVWPLHPPILPDELLSHWMIRLAHANLMKVHSFYALYFGKDKQIWTRDIDKLAPDWLIDALAKWSGSDVSSVEKATLRAYEGILFESLNPKANTLGVLPLGVYHRMRKGYGLQYCPHCLSSDSIPYFRRSWRLIFVTTCLKHRVVLRDRCENCGAPVVPHRCDIGRRYFDMRSDASVRCYRCSELLASSICESASRAVLRQQRLFESALTQGWINWAGNGSMYAHIFFEGVNALCSGLLKKQNLARIEKHSNLVRKLPKWRSARIDLLSTHDRYQVFSVASHFLKNWPDSMIEQSKRNRLLYSYFRGDYGTHPYWFEHAIKENLSYIPAKLNDREAESIVDSITHEYGHFSNSLARKKSGRDLSNYVKDQYRPEVNYEVAEVLLASLDHEIAATQNWRKRQELLRDKFMFGIGRVFHLSQSELSTITIDYIRDLVLIKEDASFFYIPDSVEQGRAWAEWYHDSTKDIKPENCEALFFSFIRKKNLNGRSVSSRFIRAISNSGLKREAESFSKFIGVKE